MAENEVLTRDVLIKYLNETDAGKIKELTERAYKVKVDSIGSKVYLRGLIELSNVCSKDCYYCGIRQSNTKVERYELTDDQVLEAAEFAWKSNYGSLVLQAGERCGRRYISKVTRLVKNIKELTNGELGITLSLGEQTKDVCKEWYDAGAHRYLLRIESSNKELYARIHPKNIRHSWDARVQAIKDLMEVG